MTGLLKGMRVVEGSAFVAAPLGGLTLAQLGADVIRFDQIGGGLDYHRWPVTAEGHSLYWAGLNKGKRSIALNLQSPEGRELALSLIAAPGPDNGIFLTNYPEHGWTSFDRIRDLRADIVMCQIVGNPDGSTAVDYTVNAAVGFPLITGPADYDGPINSMVPTWDLLAGLTAAMGILAAERNRNRTGEGQLIRLSLADIALAMLGHLGFIGEALINGVDRARYGNHLYGAFGRDFVTADGRRVMVVAITGDQFRRLIDATGLQHEVAVLEDTLGSSLDNDGDLFQAREDIARLLDAWFSKTDFHHVAQKFDRNRILWGPYQSIRELLDQDPRASIANPLFEVVDHPGIGPLLTPGLPLDLGAERQSPRPAPRLGQNTEEILSEVLGLDSHHIGKLQGRGVVAIA